MYWQTAIAHEGRGENRTGLLLFKELPKQSPKTDGASVIRAVIGRLLRVCNPTRTFGSFKSKGVFHYPFTGRAGHNTPFYAWLANFEHGT